MKRLTEWTGERWIATQSNRKLGDKDIYEKLAEYEDLRMTPSEIKSFLKDFGISLAIENRKLKEQLKQYKQCE